LAQYLVAFLLRNGYRPPETVRRALAARSALVSWADDYMFSGPSTLKDLAVRTIRSAMSARCHGNIMFALKQLHLPSRINNLILVINPF